MRILVDFHHHALAESLLLLFEDRYGADVWFPAGMDWFESGTWNFERKWHGDAVARQYLLSVWADAEDHGDGTLTRKDPRHPGRLHRGISHAAASAMRWDLVLSTLPDNDEGFASLAEKTGARFGVQVGNNHQQSRLDLASFILASSTLPGMERETSDPDVWGTVIQYAGLPTVVYHQEFSRKTFRPGIASEVYRNRVASFVNCFPETPVYPGFQQRARAWRGDFDWRVYGSYGSAPVDELQAGDISLVSDVAQAMRQARMIWHEKYWGDGFGHVIHNAFAVGRPVIGSKRYYADKLAAPLWVEGVTSWDVDRYTDDELLSIMRSLREDDERWREVCAASAMRFVQVVDFDREAEGIASMLGL